MCFFRKKKPQQALKPSAPAYKTETFVFDKIPASLEELRSLKDAALATPFATAALTMLALCAYTKNKDAGIAMLNFLRGPRPLSPMDIQFLRDRFMDKGNLIPFSYFEGSSPANNYVPTQPFTLKISEHAHSYDNENYASLSLVSSGADSPRQIQLRKKGSGEWFLWEQSVMVGIKPAKADDPWA